MIGGDGINDESNKTAPAPTTKHRLDEIQVIYGCACLWSNLYGGKLADKGHGVEPLTHIRPIYCVQAVCLCLLAFASLLAVGATTLLRPYVER